MTRGWAIRNGSTRGPPRTRQRSGRVATMSAIGGLAEEDRDLTEEVAARRDGPALSPSTTTADLAVEDHVEARPGEPLAEDLLALGVGDLLERVGDPFELRRRQVREQRRSRRSRR